jgi:hypothetical protein
MDQVFRGQTLALAIDMEMSLDGVTSQRIMYKKPDGTTGSWSATIDGEKLVTNLAHGELNQEGIWIAQGEIYIGSAKYPSSPVTILVDEPVDAQ